MNQHLQQIFDTSTVTDSNGVSYDLHSNTNMEQCAFLQGLVRKVKPKRSLEIGLAYGISSLAILEALAESYNDFRHTVIDPFQSTAWKGVGLEYIKRAGFQDNIRFFERMSYDALPELVKEKERIQFAYIDSTKVFDILLVDVFFINFLLEVGGIMVLDDCSFPGIRKLVRFLSVHPSFRVLEGFGRDESTAVRRFVTSLNYGVLNVLPFKEKTLSGYNFKQDSDLGLDYHCIAFTKVKEDNRNWDWFQAF